MHCADCTICFLHLQKGGREERGVVAGGENAVGGERERVKQRGGDGEENKAGKRRGSEEGERQRSLFSGVRRVAAMFTVAQSHLFLPQNLPRSDRHPRRRTPPHQAAGVLGPATGHRRR